MKIAVIGDIHGCKLTLEKAYNQLKLDDVYQIYSVGDLIDRGPDPAGVVQFCMDKDIVCVMGNHEKMLLDALFEPNEKERFHLSRMWLHNGGFLKDANAYEKPLFDPYDTPFSNDQINYIKNLPYYVFADNVFICHAGLTTESVAGCLKDFLGEIISGKGSTNGDHRIKLQNELIWNRKTGSHYQKGYYQVYGHTPQMTRDNNPRPLVHDTWANIDTGCVYPRYYGGGFLTAIVLESVTKKILEIPSWECIDEITI